MADVSKKGIKSRHHKTWEEGGEELASSGIKRARDT